MLSRHYTRRVTNYKRSFCRSSDEPLIVAETPSCHPEYVLYLDNFDEPERVTADNKYNDEYVD